MKRLLLILIMTISLVLSCGSKRSVISSNDINVVKNDTIYKLINQLCGYWDFIGQEKKGLNEKGIGFTSMSIECYNLITYKNSYQILPTDISIQSKDIKKSELFNQLSIRKGLFLLDLDSKLPDSANNIFLKESDSVVISKVDDHYGFQYFGKDDKNFIPIKALNDSILILVDGRQYKLYK